MNIICIPDEIRNMKLTLMQQDGMLNVLLWISDVCTCACVCVGVSVYVFFCLHFVWVSERVDGWYEMTALSGLDPERH